jgi:Protein of unknown function (DUF2971)
LNSLLDEALAFSIKEKYKPYSRLYCWPILQPRKKAMAERTDGRRIGRGRFLRELFKSLYSGTGDEIAAPLPYGKSLVHYTNLNTLIEIIKTDDLWMTDARYSNDRQEIVGGFTAVRKRIGSKLRKDRQFNALVDDWLTKREENRFYVTCFCTNSDLLSQWRAYGADGEGINISLDGKVLSSICNLYRKIGTLILAPVVYRDDKKNDLVDKVLEFGRSLSVPPKTQARVISFALTVFAATFKSQTFEEEAEWRLCLYQLTLDLREQKFISGHGGTCLFHL